MVAQRCATLVAECSEAKEGAPPQRTLDALLEQPNINLATCRSSTERPKEWERNLNPYDKCTHRIPGEADRPERAFTARVPSTEEERLPGLNCKAPDDELKVRCKRCADMIVCPNADSSRCHQQVSLHGERCNHRICCLRRIANMCTRNDLAPFGSKQRGESGAITVTNSSRNGAAK
jgi:hypothetical protein